MNEKPIVRTVTLSLNEKDDQVLTSVKQHYGMKFDSQTFVMCLYLVLQLNRNHKLESVKK